MIKDFMFPNVRQMKFKLDTGNRDLFTAVTLLSGYHSVTDINYFTNTMKRVCGVELTKATLNMAQSSYFQLKAKFGIIISDRDVLKFSFENVSQVPFIILGRRYKSDKDRIEYLLPPHITIKKQTFITLYERVYKGSIPADFMKYMIAKSGDKIKYNNGSDGAYPSIVYKSHTRCESMNNAEELREYVRFLFNHLIKSNEIDNDITHYDIEIPDVGTSIESLMFTGDLSAVDLHQNDDMDVDLEIVPATSHNGWNQGKKRWISSTENIAEPSAVDTNYVDINMDMDDSIKEPIIEEVKEFHENKLETVSHATSLEEGELCFTEVDTMEPPLDISNKSPPTSQRVDDSQGLSIITSDASLQTLYALQQDISDGSVDSIINLTQNQRFVAEIFKIHKNNYDEFVSVYTHLKAKKLLF